MNSAITSDCDKTHPLSSTGNGVRLGPEMARLLRWAPSGALALLDQGLISGSNFLLGISLARTAGPESFGAYTVMFSVFLLIANVHQALLLEPTNVFAFSLFPERSDRYLRAVLIMHAIFTAIFIAVAGSILMIAPRLQIRGALAGALAGMVVATPCVLLFWLARCFAYLDFAPARAARGSLTYSAALLAGVSACLFSGGMTPLRAFLCTALAAVVASLFLLYRYRGNKRASVEPGLPEVWRRHWRFGRWGLGTVGLSWAQTNSISVISGSLLGLQMTGGLNALISLLLPMFQVLSSATRVVLPRIAQIYTWHGLQSTKRPVLRVAAILVFLTTTYWLALALGHNLLLHLTYGQRFAPYAHLIPIIGFHVVACSIITICDIGFASIQAPQLSFRTKLVMVAVILPVNTALTWRFGLLGAVIGVPVLTTATGFCMAARLRQVWRQHDASVIEGVTLHA
jgi:O-antigen/teichoic acid export membrane protein